jgi:outer membrane protein assembly factor BamA
MVKKLKVFIVAINFLVLSSVTSVMASGDPSERTLSKKISENSKQLQQIKFEIDALGINEKLKRKIPISVGEIRAYKQLTVRLDRISKSMINLTLEQLKALNLQNQELIQK